MAGSDTRAQAIPIARRDRGGRLLRWLRAIAGTLAAALAIGGAVTAAANDAPPTGAVPADWQQFGGVLKSGIERRFSGDDDLARRFQRLLAERKAAGALPPSMLLSTWVSDRRISRVVVDDGDPARLGPDIRMLLVGEEIAATAPSDMPQPVRMRFLLRPGEGAPAQ